MRLDPSLVLDSIRRLDSATIKLVAFTGGEPFLVGADLVSFIREASLRGFTTRVVTSAYFGTTPERADAKIQEVVHAGLNELSISWDDFHEEFVSSESVRNVVLAAKRHDCLRLAVNIVQTAISRWSVARVRDELGVRADDVVVESPINLTGRAEEQLREAGLRRERAIGPCPYVMTGPTLSAKGKLLACCGVIPDTDRLCIDPHFTPDKLHEALNHAQKSPLLNWIYLRGPYAIMQWISDRFGVPIPPKGRFGGNCEACKCLFDNREIGSFLDRALSEKAAEIVGELQLLESLGMDGPTKVLELWSEESIIVNKYINNALI